MIGDRRTCRRTGGGGPGLAGPGRRAISSGCNGKDEKTIYIEMLDCAWNVELEVELTADTASLDVTVLSSFGVGCGVVVLVAVRTAVFGSTVVVVR